MTGGIVQGRNVPILLPLPQPIGGGRSPADMGVGFIAQDVKCQTDRPRPKNALVTKWRQNN